MKVFLSGLLSTLAMKRQTDLTPKGCFAFRMGFLVFLLLLLILALVILVFLHQWLELATEQVEVL